MAAEGTNPRIRVTAPKTGRRAALFALAVVTAPLTVGGCTSSGGMSTAALPKLPKITLPEAPPPVVGTSTEVYERIGRGAMACWFGANGFLKGTHIYEAKAEPPHKGGQAEIIIRERDNAAESPRGIKAFHILISPAGSDQTMTTVVAENLKLPETMAAGMKTSVAAWSTGSHSCDADAFKGAWQPEAAPPATAPAAQKQKTTQR